ncbi:outer membrane protein [Legionella spiritensis]|uniref:Uncharacterized protein n=1 Tax=Legionella spiritensis TaxID=452 RepID=A0A0W0Z577_LEGSP|nr:outer membrane beta-barrel protein [Legionella spiritensis]KTD64311.1 hypothetical protein Lspi_1118 [Legionella spiritensis]SNV46699.1 Opacity protein and related surface antigens [Legionella spiritensis]VEG91124.1 Opacity protein and related surface antigens [Legionella spiritensis]
MYCHSRWYSWKTRLLNINLLLWISHASIAAHPLPVFLDDTLSLTGGIGYTTFPNPSDQQLSISPYVTDLLTNSRQHHIASYSFHAQKQLNIHGNHIHKIMLGPAFYYQTSHYSGDVWEMTLPEFYNYQYDFKSKNSVFLLESDIYLKPVAGKLFPFLTAGAGFSIAHTSYDDHALPDIPADSEIHWSRSRVKAVYELGAGLTIPVNTHWAFNLRYAYLNMGKVSTTMTPFQPVSINLNSQNVFFGINYSV